MTPLEHDRQQGDAEAWQSAKALGRALVVVGMVAAFYVLVRLGAALAVAL